MTSVSMAPAFRKDRMAQGWASMMAISQAGDAIWLIGLTWTAVQNASPAAAGLIVAAGTIPRGILLLFGGVVADRFDSRRVMLLANALRLCVLVAVMLAAMFAEPTLPILVAAAIGFGVSDAVHEPSAATIGRQLVEPDDLPAYAGLTQTLARLGTMGGNAVGGIVVVWWGTGGSAALNAITFAVLIVFILAVLRPRFPLERAAAQPPLTAIGEGFAHLRDAPITRMIVLSLSGLNLFVGPALGIGLALRVHAEDWGAESLGVLLALVGAGGVLGSLMLVIRRPRRPALAGFLLLVPQGVAICALGIGGLVMAGLAALVIGVTAGAASTLLSATFVRVVDGAYLGRMVSIQRLGDDVLMPGATAGFGALAAATTVSSALCLYGVCMVVLVLLPLRSREMRQLR